MSSEKKFALVAALSSLIFGTVAATATVALISDATPSPTLLAQRTQQQEPTAQVVEENDFKFQLQSCPRTGEKVNCSLLITNLAKEDRALTLYTSGSRSIDFSGNVYAAQTVQVGGVQSGIIERAKFIQGIPIKGNVRFKLPQSVTQLALVEIHYKFGGVGGESSTVKFRNVGIIGSS